jgi:hypothetical protein
LPQDNLLVLLHLHRQLRARQPEERPPLERRVERAAAAVARALPGDPAKAGELLGRLLEAKDNHVFGQLMLAAGYSSSAEVRSGARACAAWRRHGGPAGAACAPR